MPRKKSKGEVLALTDDNGVSPEQQLLFEAGAELLNIEERAQSGKYSGAIIERDREKVHAICAALAEDMPVRAIARAFKVSQHTVMGIRARHPELVAMGEKQLSTKLGMIQKVGWDRYYEGIINGEVHPAQLPVGLGIAADKKAALDGKPSVIIEHRDRELTPEAINELIAKLPSVPGAVIDAGPSDSGSDAGGANGQ